MFLQIEPEQHQPEQKRLESAAVLCSDESFSDKTAQQIPSADIKDNNITDSEQLPVEPIPSAAVRDDVIELEQIKAEEIPIKKTVTIEVKIHKTPLSTRPVVSCCGSFNEVFSRWLDYRMKTLLQFYSLYIKDSQDLLKTIIQKLGKLPVNARLFTSDACSMYTNIDLRQALHAFRGFLDHFSDVISSGFPSELL